MGRGIWILCLAWLGCTTGSVARVQADDGHCNALLDLAARRQLALMTLQRLEVCVEERTWEDPEEPQYRYLRCLYPDELEGGMLMHSYVFVGGELVGNGFKITPDRMAETHLVELLEDAGAHQDCPMSCDGIVSAQVEAAFSRTIRSSPVALYGWGGCPCTTIVRRRFEEAGVCYVQDVWAEPDAQLMKFLQCKYGDFEHEHHSFVFVDGEFVGDGFALASDKMSDARLTTMLRHANARFTCQREGDTNLIGGSLESCTQDDDTPTGWTRSGSCNWDPSDSGYHEVCVTMSSRFLDNSAKHDANDLTSVVSEGGHWCICAWAFAAAVQRDPVGLEGIELDCARTNDKLREVYNHFIQQGQQLRSPSGASYEAQAALDRVDALCGAPAGSSEAVGHTSGRGAGETAPHRERMHIRSRRFLDGADTGDDVL